MKIIFLLIIISVVFSSCGKKDDPEYKSYIYKNNIEKTI